MKPPRLGLIFRMALLVVCIEITAFSVLGWFYIHRYTTAADEQLRSRLRLVGQMIASEELPVSAISRRSLVGDLVGAPYVAGTVVGGSGRVIVSTEPAFLGRQAVRIANFSPRWFDGSAPEESFVAGTDTLTYVTHVHGGQSDSPIYYTVLTVGTSELNARKRSIVLWGEIGSALFMVLSSVGIIVVAQRLITRRVDLSLAVLDEVERGALDARIPVSSEDELGQLQKGINSMTTALAALLAEHRRNEESVRRFNADLEQRVAERTAQLKAANDELEAFSYSVSHDLRAPLRAIDGFSQILLEDYEERLDEEGRRNLAVIRGNAVRMGHLIDDILDFSRMSRREMQLAVVDMAALTREVFAEVRATVPTRQVELRLADLPAARGDAAMVRQVLVNLLANAVKFTAPRAEAVIEVGGIAGGEQNTYFVKDNGVGFDMQYVDKLFGVFQRLHSASEFEGTGIGLAIVKRIVTRHGGRVWAEGEVGKGACLSFTLPSA